VLGEGAQMSIRELNEIVLPLQLATKEIARIASHLSRLSEHDSFIQPMPDTDADFAQCPQQAYFERAVTIIRSRKLRNKLLGEIADFGEPQWDMLLDLYVSKGRGQLISVSSVCLAANVPPTTALRHLSSLVANELVERYRPNHDRRLVYLRLTDRAIDGLDLYFSRLLSGGH
jgi:DNA-binding MarR family transcriptional regulator